jgi:RNA polymerase sigma-70 factor (ECF subfamily)
VPEARLPTTTEPLDDGLLRAEERARLWALLKELDARTCEALVLRFTAQLTLAEIGAVLGMSEDAVRKRITRALHALKEQYRDDTR